MRREYDALAAARAQGGTREGRRLDALRRGVESSISQAVRACDLRRARTRGLAKMGLENVATTAAIDPDQIAAWLAGPPLAPARTSRFAGLAAYWRLRQQCPTLGPHSRQREILNHAD